VVAEDHRSQAPVADRERFDPGGRRLAVPERQSILRLHGDEREKEKREAL
jgi:hypothetical protein